MYNMSNPPSNAINTARSSWLFLLILIGLLTFFGSSACGGNSQPASNEPDGNQPDSISNWTFRDPTQILKSSFAITSWTFCDYTRTLISGLAITRQEDNPQESTKDITVYLSDQNIDYEKTVVSQIYEGAWVIVSFPELAVRNYEGGKIKAMMAGDCDCDEASGENEARKIMFNFVTNLIMAKKSLNNIVSMAFRIPEDPRCYSEIFIDSKTVRGGLTHYSETGEKRVQGWIDFEPTKHMDNTSSRISGTFDVPLRIE